MTSRTDADATDVTGPAPFRFRRDELMPVADAHRASYTTAQPFPHVVIDDFLPPSVLQRVLDEFPEPDDRDWEDFDNPREVKLALADTEEMGPNTRELLSEFNGQVFMEFVERLTSIDGLVTDPHFHGGGLHQIRPGGYLKVHADFNRHTRLDLDRRINGLVYLNPDWDESYGGHLELWDRTMTRPVERILPVFNRFVLFSTDDFSYHGHPEPLTCPPDRTRRSLALYYYSNGRPPEELSGDHSTLFRERPGEEWRSNARQLVKAWTPPAVTDWSSRRRDRKRT
jgi:hypothetical protein